MSDRVRLKFTRKFRLTLAKEYAAVYGAKLKKTQGPLTLCAKRNELGHLRLGLAISRKVGGAVVRTRLKRMLREAFRHEQYSLPRHSTGSYDLVVAARAHPQATLDEYRGWLKALASAVHREAERRERRG